jgi:hypothetical protein
MNQVRINEELLSDTVILSNTPSFLFRRFRRDATVQMLAERFSEFELAEFARQYGTRANRSFLDKVYAYANIVALSFKPASAIRDALRKQPAPAIPWANELIAQAIVEAPSETLKTVRYIQNPVILAGLGAPVSTTQTVVIEGLRPALRAAQPVLCNNQMRVINLDSQ